MNKKTKIFSSRVKMSQAQPLSTLNLTTVSTEPAVAVVPASSYKKGMGRGFGKFLFWFIILTVFIWLILYSTNPSWVRGSGGVAVDTGKVLLWSLIIALIIIIIVWIIMAALAGRWGCM